MIQRTLCVVCNHSILPFFSFPHFPIKITCDVEPAFGEAELSYGKCGRCNTIQLDKLIPLQQLYSSSHNNTIVGNVWADFFRFFTAVISPYIIDKTVLEIGCPSGKIALQASLFKKWYIVEPNRNEGVELPPTIEFIERFFDDDLVINETVTIDIIIHSHLYEHIYNPRSFLQKCNSLLKENGKMIFAIPNMEHISKNHLSPCNGVFYEHTVFYNNENVSYLLETSGFTNIEVIPFDKHSLVFYCEKVKEPEKKTETEIPVLSIDTIQQFHNSIVMYEDVKRRCIEYNNNNNINNDNNENPIFIFGASYNSIFLLYFLRDTNIQIKGILDNNPDKQGKYLFGTNLRIYSPSSIISKYPSLCILLRNGYYNDEIKRQLLSLKKDIHFIE